MKAFFRRFDYVEIVVAALAMVVMAVIAFGLYANIQNASNKIDEGVIIDKNYSAAYVTYNTVNTGKSTSLIPVNHPETYSLTIKGEKDGETVEYLFYVPATEYNNYNIGDYYKK
ncbi:MAG: hypothetical protein NC253_05250 [Ruminococcus sp.]|nr:hypothetical protein [Ruminococcus sp.]MCM1380323.1 hypothetical protein [Muribaculaceae bacterium]MCM1478235.1 hypothetical protein [Muribaculaceae bacterium]